MKRIYKLLFMLIVALPIGNQYYPMLDFLEVGYGVNILDVCFTIFLAISLLFTNPVFKISKSKAWIWGIVSSAIFLFLFVLIKSYSNEGMRALRDGFNYFMCIEFLLLAITLKKTWLHYYDVIEAIEYGFIIYTALSLASFIFFFGGEGRIMYNTTTLYLKSAKRIPQIQ